MFNTFVPKKFCREFVLLRGHSLQLASIMAVIQGHKPCLDDWVACSKLAEYEKICRRYGLSCKVDAVFRCVPPSRIGARVVGAERLTTTHAYGLPWSPAVTAGTVHVFIARSRAKLEACWRSGWYPLVIKGRVVEKPQIDIHRFGAALGYPACCRDFFRLRNNWFFFNFLYEVFKNSGTGPYPFLCNPLTRDETYSYLSHMPCSFACASSLALARRIRSGIKAEEPAFAAAIDRHLRLPLLVFRERWIYAFEGVLKGQRLTYGKVAYVGNQDEGAAYLDDFKRGDSLRVDADTVAVLKRGRTIKKIAWGARQDAHGRPFLIAFR
ncbi:MAG: hypothetical protein ACM3L6_02920 [Deltaproteobacteria bacterium]